MKEEMSNPFGLEERKFLLDVTNIVGPHFTPLDQIHTTGLAFSRLKSRPAFHGVKAVKPFLTLAPSAPDAK